MGESLNGNNSDPNTVDRLSHPRIDRSAKEIVQDIVKAELIRNGYTLGDSIYIMSAEVYFYNTSAIESSVTLTLRNSISNEIMFQRSYRRHYLWKDELIPSVQSFAADFVGNIPALELAENQGPSAPTHTIPTISSDQQPDRTSPISAESLKEYPTGPNDFIKAENKPLLFRVVICLRCLYNTKAS